MATLGGIDDVVGADRRSLFKKAAVVSAAAVAGGTYFGRNAAAEGVAPPEEPVVPLVESLPLGGTAGSVLSKASAADQDATWVTRGQLAADPAFSSLYGTTRSVVAFGATGDGVTDDAPAIQACIDSSLPGDVIFFPTTGAAPNAGTTYLVGTDILLSEGRAYVGPLAPNGVAAVNIKYRDGVVGTAVLTSKAYALNGATSAAPVRIENLRISGNKAGNASGHGILLMNYNSLISHTYVSSTSGAGIVLSDTNAAGTLISNNMVECRIEACNIFHPGTHGVWVKDTRSAGKITDGWCREVLVAHPGEIGIYIQRAAGWFITSNHVYAAATDGYRLQAMWNTYVIGNEADGFGASLTPGVTGIGFNFDGILAGRPSAIAHNVAATNEARQVSNAYIYYRVRNQAPALTTYVQFVDNKAHQDTTGGAQSTAISLQPNTNGVLHFYEVGSLMGGLPVTVGATGVVHRQDLTGRIAGYVETMPRDSIDPTVGSPILPPGRLVLTYFTADQTLTVTRLATATRGAAQVGATLARMALYAINPATGEGICIARTASDPTLWNGPQSLAQRSIVDDGQGVPATSVKIIQGRRYALGVIQVGATTNPTLAGKAGIAGLNSGTGPTTRSGGYVGSMSDAPASFAGATVNANADNANYFYARLT